MSLQEQWFQWGPAVAILVLVLIAVGGFLFWYFKNVATKDDERQKFLERLVDNATESHEKHMESWQQMTREGIEAQQQGVAAMQQMERALALRCQQAEKFHDVTVQHLTEMKSLIVSKREQGG